MFINLRGTSGSGKTTIMRQLMAKAESKTPFYISGRKQPAWYAMKIQGRTVGVLGHYETACGGCDTINKLDQVAELARQAFHWGCDIVVAEGLLLGKDVSRVVELPNPHVLYLNTEVNDCYAGVRHRRLDKAIEKYGDRDDIPQEAWDKINGKPKALEADHKSIKSAVDRLRDKVTVLDITRDNGLDTILQLLA